MKTTEFSARGLAALKPRAERFEVKGGGGLKLRVYPSGQRVLPVARPAVPRRSL